MTCQINRQKSSKNIILKTYNQFSRLTDFLPSGNSWVEQAVNRSMAYLKANELDKTQGLSDINSKLALRSAELDSIGITHLRLEQINNNVPVFSGQLTTHVDSQGKTTALGRTFSEAELVETTPKLTEAEAIETAKSALSYKGEFAKLPTASLVILPKWVTDQKSETKVAKLTYLVELLIEDGTKNTARHFYFVNAKNGEIVWHYDNLQRQAVTVGTGYSLYSGTVNFRTTRPLFTLYWMEDRTKCPNCNIGYSTGDSSYTEDMRNGTGTDGYTIFDEDNIYGDTTSRYFQRIASDAHFGMSQTWDYYNNVHGRYGIDGNGYPVRSHVRYGVNYNDAFWDGTKVFYGDGDGVFASPLVSVDTVGHEITHGLTERTAALIYANESGGANESFSDIFGTAVEFYTNINPDYLVAEDWYTPSIPGDAVRYMDNPPADGVSIDNYSQYYPGMDVHQSSGIQNKAFYLLATSSSGRDAAEKVFYRALTVYLFPSATFHDVRVATITAAADLYGSKSGVVRDTGIAWNTVGVF